MEIISSLYQIEVEYYSETSLLNLLKDRRVKIYDFKVKDTYLFGFKIDAKNYKQIKNDLKTHRIIKKEGIFPFIAKQLLHRVTIIASILAIILFIFCTTLLIKIEIVGTSKEVNEQIAVFLKEKEIKKYGFKPSIKRLKELKDEYFLNNLDTVENIEFIIEGNALYVHYNLKKQAIELEKKHGKMYASKDAIIDKIEISSGNVLVKEFDYVKRGQLLVDDYLYYKDNPIYVGTRGRIYAYTYESVLVSVYYEGEKEDQFVYLIDEARREVSLGFDDEERIEKETINDFYSYDKHVYLNISYTLYENIVTF